MKTLVAFAFLFIITNICYGATYYIDATDGNDSKTGTSIPNAWKTISKVNGSGFSPGDFVLFEKGETWREQLVVADNGTEGNPITFGSYGSGSKPAISGADVITGWTVYNGSVYEANVSSEVTQLFVDGAKQTLARWPDSGWYDIKENSANSTYLKCDNLIQVDNYWVNATITIKTVPYRIETKTVTANSQNENKITWDGDTAALPKTNYGFYLEGKLETVNAMGEWCYNDGKVYLHWTENPDNATVEGSVRGHGIRVLPMSKEHINIKDLSIKYTSSHGIYISYCSYIDINNNTISSSKGRGIYVKSYPPETHDHIYITNNSISQTKDDGICVRNIDCGEITDNDLTDIASDEVSPKKATAILAEGNTNFTISGNRVDKVSYIGIRADSAGNNTVSYNNISNCLLLLYDGGGIYSWGENSEDLIIKHNIVRDIIGNAEGTPAAEPHDVIGIYLDEQSSGVTVEGNVVFNCGTTGMLLHRAHDNRIINNVFYNNHGRAVHLSEKALNEMYDNDFYNNIFFATGADELTWQESSNFSSSGTMGTYNNNLHYSLCKKPIEYSRSGVEQFFTSEEWQDFSGQEKCLVVIPTVKELKKTCPLLIKKVRGELTTSTVSVVKDAQGRTSTWTEEIFDLYGNSLSKRVDAYSYYPTDEIDTIIQKKYNATKIIAKQKIKHYRNGRQPDVMPMAIAIPIGL